MAKGRKTGGRKKGTLNKVNAEGRELFRQLFDRLLPDVEDWIRECAAGVEKQIVKPDGTQIFVREGADPGKAAELAIRLAEYHFPKLGRQEHTGEAGSPIVVEIRKFGADDAR